MSDLYPGKSPDEIGIMLYHSYLYMVLCFVSKIHILVVAAWSDTVEAFKMNKKAITSAEYEDLDGI